MQVDRQPSPWPCVAMLVGLLLFCLMVPRYWRQDSRTPDEPAQPSLIRDGSNDHRRPSIAAEMPPFGIIGSHLPFTLGQGVRIPDGSVPVNEMLSLWTAPTIEELIAARFGTSSASNTSIGWPTFEPFAASSQSGRDQHETGTAATVPGPQVTAMLEQAGRVVAEYSSAQLIPRLAVKIVDVYQHWSSDVPLKAEALSTLRILGPGNRSAVVRPPARRMFSIPEPMELDLSNVSDPWCVPKVLFEHLQRLAQHPYSSEWAGETIAQLRALTERDSLDGDDIQKTLVALSGSAREAVLSAEETDDDRLRVELLRAHWAIARRLDRWAVVHEIRVAARAGNRVAARGSLGPYFEGLQNSSLPPTDPLTQDLEAYEHTRDPQLGRKIISEQRALVATADSLDRALADAVEQHYRNANVRVAITAEMLNRFVEQEQSEVRALREQIAGAPVRGQSHTQSTSRVRLNPATGRWELAVESDGMVESNAQANGGPARLRSRMATDFTARKRVVVDQDGVLLQPTSIDVNSHNRLVGVTTDYDWVPLMGSYARNRAMQEYRARQSRAKVEVESRVASEAVNTIDDQTRRAVERIEQQIRNRFTDRLEVAGVKVTPIEMTTTHERVVARLRVASDEQPGSHTPRPRALSDSLASMQIHETALTNAAISLELDGQHATATELQAMLREKFPAMQARSLAENQRDTVFHFAERDAVRLHIDGGRLELTLAMSSVEHEGRTMRRFIVHAYYAPVVNGLEAELVRSGALGIEGRLSSSERARLHNVFNSVLPPERTLPIVRLDDANDKRLAGLMITQLVLEDGWLGLAVGPATSARVAERSRSLR